MTIFRRLAWIGRQGCGHVAMNNAERAAAHDRLRLLLASFAQANAHTGVRG